MHMALPLKKSEVLCFYDLQYRWAKRSTDRGVEIKIELNEFPDGQMIIAQCPRVFRPDMVEDIIEYGRENRLETGGNQSGTRSPSGLPNVG